MDTIYVNNLRGPDLFDGLGPRWGECSEAIEQALKASVIKWGNVSFEEGFEPFEYELKGLKEKAKRTGSEFIRCEGYSLWRVNDWPETVKFVRNPEGIYGCYCEESEENVESLSSGQV